ncbi:hypothetical protein SFRURICE_018240 [Spodoptera frugiperda]|nr:hypothetical protein SFRURICE_018240 [Spodoptera frugiperda]
MTLNIFGLAFSILRELREKDLNWKCCHNCCSGSNGENKPHLLRSPPHPPQRIKYLSPVDYELKCCHNCCGETKSALFRQAHEPRVKQAVDTEILIYLTVFHFFPDPPIPIR